MSLRRNNRIAGIGPALITKPDWLDDFKHWPDSGNALLLDAMSKAKIKKVSPIVNAIVLGQSGFDLIGTAQQAQQTTITILWCKGETPNGDNGGRHR